MADFAQSDDPAVQKQLDRLSRLSPGADILGLDRITRLLDALGNPHHRLPPVFHVAGTNGKGSVCAVLRAAFEADGKTVHSYTSPHLVRFNERIRLNGTLIGDAELADYLRRVLDIAEPIGPSFFEATTAAAFLAFSERRADACIIEVGLGGRLDATNVIGLPAACGIAQLGVDHEAFLGNDPAGIAREKAGIARTGSPLVTMAYPLPIREAIGEVVAGCEAHWLREGSDWHFARIGDTLRVIVGQHSVDAQIPALVGAHQIGNAALAIAMIMAQRLVPVLTDSLAVAPARAKWPGRLQRLGQGPLTTALGDRAVWLDGGHNVAAAEALASHLGGGERHMLIVGLLANKDLAGWMAALAPHLSGVIAIPIDGHAHHSPADVCRIAHHLGLEATAASDIAGAVDRAARISQQPVLIAGSLYLAGEVLRINQQMPD